ncbi:fluoride efflux transporter CrcB [Pararhodospirillum photometricum]|uniref:Fluoride-specific ion channel FluC n=1 Tax=Pararhodospirillum photometricum DSM 122 TaxID=1150469 RepID=H6SN96_PARPM|nr:fluoride efflux transporter CrcB [Pararhodospirillum photometricum]CCG06972.1 Protein crcB homolog [Pararhodospirillum photometricum DSM 122]
MTFALIAVGSALGGVLRYWMSGWVAAQTGQTFPWGTLAVNILGSFVIGLFATLTAPEGRWLVPGEIRQFFMTGVCGGFTTFSSFSLQTLALAQDGQWLWAGLNVVGSVVLCLLGVWLGHLGAQLLTASGSVLRGLWP